ncbi:hypothetical protein [Hymenobacter jeollabukensis]|uniref:Glycosyltransferase RgtA/B/C/D-like domain-containing protein n=1 Tax=Hymenobacter jeollabukensis TaxID=2025313 RepID=A0A5R8WWX5_9BACT|nr:hypothetical protein [Hymenobacter jeollabukensis]TLM96655.1 hypothetical protein FDY95_01270 [Hymenobacter jeollabukensis]
MKLLLLLVANAAVLGGLYRWLRAQRRVAGLGYLVVPTLALRLLAGAVSTIRPTDDAWYYHLWSGQMAAQLWAAPGQWLQMLTTDEFHFGERHLVFHGYSNTFFFMKLLSAFGWLTGDSLLLQALYLSLAAFGACWTLVRVLSQLFPGTRGAAVVSLLLWPSALYWSSGVTKESLLLAGSALLLASVLMLLYGPAGTRRWLWAAGALLGTWLSFKMRFFFGGALLAVLLALATVHVVSQLGGPLRRRRWQALLLIGLLGAGAWGAGEVSPVFRFNKFASQLTRTYSALRQKSLGRPHVALPELAPTAESILRHTPKAIASTLFRPFAWEGDTVFYGFAALENLGLLLLAALAAWDWAHRRRAPLPFLVALGLLLYCLLMAALVGLSTPNLGTLSRYRAPWLPLLVYLLLAQPTAAGLLRRLRILTPA